MQFREQNSKLKLQLDQIDSKYKRSLQEINNVIQKNNSLRNQIDAMVHQNEKNILEIQFDFENKRKEDFQVLQAKTGDFNAQILKEKQASLLLENKIQILERQKIGIIDELKSALSQKEQLTKQNTILMKQNQSKGKTLIKYKGEKSFVKKQQNKANQEINKYKEMLSDLQKQVSTHKEKHMRQLIQAQQNFQSQKKPLKEQNTIMRFNYGNLVKKIESYEQVDKLIVEKNLNLHDQSIQIETLYESLRTVVDQLCNFYNKFHLSQQSDKHFDKHMIKNLQRQLSQSMTENIKLKQQINSLGRDLSKDKQRQKKLNEKVKEVKNERDYAAGSSIVWQAMLQTEKWRIDPSEMQRLNEFQNRIEVLVGSDLNKYSEQFDQLSHFIMLKAYVKQLSQLLSESRKTQTSTIRKYKKLKETLSNKDQQHQKIIQHYNKKIMSFDALVNKLYGLLEEKFLSSESLSVSTCNVQDFDMAIENYEKKLLSLSDEFVKIKNKLRQEEEEKQREKYLIKDFSDKIKGMEAQIVDLRRQNKQTMSKSQHFSQAFKENELKFIKLSKQAKEEHKLILHYEQVLKQKQIQLQHYQREIKALQMFREEYESEQDILKSRNQDFETKIADLERVISEKNSFLSHKEQVLESQQKLIHEKAKKTDEMLHIISELSNRKENLQIQNRDLRLKKEQNQQIIDAKDKELNIERKVQQHLKNSFNYSQNSQQGVNQLTQKIQILQNQKQQLEIALLQIRKQYRSSINQQKNQELSDFLKSKTQNLMLKNQIKDMQELIHDLKRQNYRQKLQINRYSSLDQQNANTNFLKNARVQQPSQSNLSLSSSSNHNTSLNYEVNFEAFKNNAQSVDHQEPIKVINSYNLDNIDEVLKQIGQTKQFQEEILMENSNNTQIDQLNNL